MTQKIMLINEADDECRIAIVEDGLLQEMLIEHRTKEQIKNNIYKGTVVQVQPSLQAAFVDFGLKKHGFLPSGEINHALLTKKNIGGGSPIQQKIKKGQSVLVQVTREAIDQKGAALTTFISLPGRFMVLMPNSNKGGVSKRIEDSEERERLKSFLSGIETEKHAIIIRTAGVGRDLNDLKKDYTTIKRTWEAIYEKYKNMAKPGLIQEEADVITRTLRDYYSEDIQEIWVDNPETFQKVHHFLKEVSPRKQKDLRLFVGDRSLFSTYRIERQVEQLTSREIKLNSGGSIVIEQTEALVSIDVNSGRSNQEGDIDATALRTNLEAAREIARQLRLRNMGGLIVIDFIDMDREESRRKVESELQRAMERDKAHRKYNPISQFGILEMSRQRLSIGISSTVESVCPTCNGKGRILSLLASTNHIIRSIREIAANGNLQRVEGKLPLNLANHLLNERRQSIADLELEFGINILLRGDPSVTVFNESLLKPVYDKETGAKTVANEPVPIPMAAAEPDRKSDDSKTETPRKKPRRREKEPIEKRSDEVESEGAIEQTAVDADELPLATSQALPSEQDTAVTPAAVTEETPKSIEKPDRKKAIVPGPVSMIHPSCLFRNVRELETDELAAITISFENRLKGKIDNKPPAPINAQYLWKTYRSAETEKTATAETLPETEQEMVSSPDPDTTPMTPDRLLEPTEPVNEDVDAAVPEKVLNAAAPSDVEPEMATEKIEALPSAETDPNAGTEIKKPVKPRRSRRRHPATPKANVGDAEQVLANSDTGPPMTIEPVIEDESAGTKPEANGVIAESDTTSAKKTKKPSTARKSSTAGGRSAQARQRKTPKPPSQNGETKPEKTDRAEAKDELIDAPKTTAAPKGDTEKEKKAPVRRKPARTGQKAESKTQKTEI
jgi:ribonuclease E